MKFFFREQIFAAIVFGFSFLFFSFCANAQTTNNLSDAELQGCALAQEILEQKPDTNSEITGVLKFRDVKGNILEDLMVLQISVSETNWTSSYQATDIFSNRVIVHIIHNENTRNDYFLTQAKLDEIWRVKAKVLSNNKTITPFAGSDFWICDLGLEFFHWPEQKILKKEMHRSRGCVVLESTNPNPLQNDYSRVVSWIDEETLGIVEAYAYDANGKLLKDFYPKDFKKVRGQWQVQTLVMENVQTGSRSRLEFDLKK
jgi:hypothetical protein